MCRIKNYLFREVASYLSPDCIVSVGDGQDRLNREGDLLEKRI